MLRLLSFSLLIFNLFLLSPTESTSDEVYALSAFKRAIYEDPFSKLSDWNARDDDPCGWNGVTCSVSDNRVVSLNLSNASLKGFLAQEIGSLASLQELILDNNLLLGSIPKEIGSLTNLNTLDLSMNNLTGPIPSELANLSTISKMYIQQNSLTGTIPDEFGDLVTLVELRLDRNRLTGVIPGNNASTINSSGNTRTGLCKLTQLNIANFSYNYFNGEIPSCLTWLSRTSFQDNCFQDSDSIFQRSTQQCTNGQASQKSPSKISKQGQNRNKIKEPIWLLILEIITGTLILIFLIICLIISTKKCMSRRVFTVHSKRVRTSSLKDHSIISIDEGLLENVKRLSRQVLEEACEDFSNIIGSSSDTLIYKGTLKGDEGLMEIAVVSLCISRNYWTTSYLEGYFKKEVADMARLNHENVAKLVGYCKEYDPFSRMLVFQYASNGTLYEHLHDGDEFQLSWPRRMRIVLGIARGLRYLHSELEPPFALTELNSCSVYLTEDFSPKLVDFERWKSLSAKPGMDSGSIFEGRSFESFHSLMDSNERKYMYVQGNIFSFGIILLELISGRSPFSKDTGHILDWAMKYLDDMEGRSNLVDPNLNNVKNENLNVLCNVVSLCIEQEQSKRPSMEAITAMLEEGIDTSTAAVLKDSNLAWAELEIS